MAGSRPEVREEVLVRLHEVGPVSGESLGECLLKLGMDPDVVSNTQFSKAVRSLHYNSGEVVYSRHWLDDTMSQNRGHMVSPH